MYKLFRLTIILITLMLTSCHSWNSFVDSDVAKDLEPEEIIQYYFNAINVKQYEKMNLVLSDEMQTRTFNYEDVKYIKLLSIEKSTVNVNELPDTVKGLYEFDIYCAKINIERYNKNNRNQKATILFYVGKDTNDSSYLIYEIQPNKANH